MNTFPISHFNGFRGANELVVYTCGDTTKTNNYGWEACVLNDRVICCGKNNNEIPQGGYVVSGHGKAALFLSKNINIGTKVIIDPDKTILTVETDYEAKLLNADAKINLIKNRIQDRIEDGTKFEQKIAEELLLNAQKARDDGNFERVTEFTDEAYYRTTVSVCNERRGAWHRPIEQSDEAVERTILRFRDAGFNILLIETNYEGYANAQKCVHDFLPIRKEYENGFDVIDAFIRIGKKHGMQIHAWFEDFFFGVKEFGCPMASIHPEWMAQRKDGGLLHDAYDNFYFLNPALGEVRALLLALCKELLDQYDFDGLQLDYIRYPVIHGIDRSAGFEAKTKEMFMDDTGIDLDKIEQVDSDDWKAFVNWRADKITSYVSSVRDLIDSYRAQGRNIELSTAVFGDPEEAIRLKCQDWRHWVKQGWLDAIYPMAYLNDAEDVGSEVKHMVEEYGEAPNISGIAPMYNHLPVIESTKQVEACRKAGAVGVAFFATHSCTDEQLQKLKIGVFRNK